MQNTRLTLRNVTSSFRRIFLPCLVILFTTPAFADGNINIANPISGSGWTVANNVVTINTDGAYVVTGTTTANRIVVAQGVTATITLSNAHIISAVASPLSLSSDGANVTLILTGSNELRATMVNTEVNDEAFCPGIQVEGFAHLTIASTGSLMAQGGENASGIGSGVVKKAGALVSSTVGTITLAGGNVTATGGSSGAGIGAGSGATGGEINIIGGRLRATGGRSAAAIGGNGTTISISGGVVIAQAPGGQGDPAAIGGGWRANAGTVNITGGSVYASGGSGPGIGGGTDAVAGGTISITGGVVVANRIGDNSSETTISGGSTVVLSLQINTQNFSEATVLTGNQVNVSLIPDDVYADVTLSAPLRLPDGATLEVPDGLWFDGGGQTITLAPGAILIGEDRIRNASIVREGGMTINVANPVAQTGWTFTDHLITITQSGTYTVTGATSQNRIVVAPGVNASIALQNVYITSSAGSPFSLGGSETSSAAFVTLTLVGNNELLSTDASSAGLQVEGSASIVIEGSGSLTAQGGGSADSQSGGGGAGIGGSVGKQSGSITLRSDIITVTGGGGAAGIGGGAGAAGGTTAILAGNVTATGGQYGAGIGGGSQGNGGSIVIRNGSITATSPRSAAAIGGGYQGNGGNITISGGTIIAIADTPQGAQGAAAVGGGAQGNAGRVSITGGTVYACSPAAAGIGGGVEAPGGGTVAISGGSVIADAIGIGVMGNAATVSINGASTLVLAPAINATTSNWGNATVMTGSNIGVTLTMDDNDADVWLYADLRLPVGAILNIPAELWWDGGGHYLFLSNDVTLTGSRQIRNILSEDNLLTADNDTLYIPIDNPTEGDGWTTNPDWALSDPGAVFIERNGVYAITGASTTHRIVVNADVTATLVLRGVTISSAVAAPITLSSGDNGIGSDVTLVLEGSNTLTGTTPNDGLTAYPGLQVEGNARLTIESKSSLTEGDGSLTVTGSSLASTALEKGGAGIGGRDHNDAGTIIINSGNISANGGAYAAGIGGGAFGGSSSASTNNSITINGGTITATGGYNAAGIGGGLSGAGGSITINNGNITANGGDRAAAIGSGTWNADGGNITIRGGNITANGGNLAAGIGNGTNGGGTGGTISVSGGIIIATGGNSGAAIGAAFQSPFGNITLSGGTIYAIPGNSANGIGTAANDTTNVGNINILGGTIVSKTIGMPNTPVSISGGPSTVVLTDSINATDFNSATVLTSPDVSVNLAPSDNLPDATIYAPFTISIGATLTIPNGFLIDANHQYILVEGTLTSESLSRLLNNENLSYTPNSNPEPASIANAQLEAQSMIYTGEPLQPYVIVNVGARTLILNVDYTVNYANNINVGSGTITVTGQGNYTGTATTPFTITPKPFTNAFVRDINARIYTGSPIEPILSVNNGKNALTAGIDYTTTCNDNLNIGEATITVTGQGNYTGSVTCSFTILPRALQDAFIQPIDALTYTGDALRPALVVKYDDQTLLQGSVVSANSAFVGSHNDSVGSDNPAKTTDNTLVYLQTPAKLSENANDLPLSSVASQSSAIDIAAVGGSDYVITEWQNNTNAGLATVVIEGQGNYRGSATATFRINPKPLSAATIAHISTQTYTGNPLEPTLTLTDGSRTLTPNQDYTATYTHNTAASNSAVVTLAGRGNYTGEVSRTFVIAPKPISTVTVAPISAQTYSGNPLEPALTVSDGWQTLMADSDYTVIYTNNIHVGEATATVRGQGNYGGQVNVIFSVAPKPVTSDFVRLPSLDYVYTGDSLCPSIVVYDGALLLTLGVDYVQVGYANNVQAGTASVIIKGLGNYGGEAAATFIILPKRLSGDCFEPIPSQIYTGYALTPPVTVKDSGRTLTDGVDYTVAYSNNINVGHATATVSGRGNYNGSVSRSFAILAGEPNDSIPDAIAPVATPVALRAEADNGGLQISELTPGEPFAIYTLQGQQLYQTIAPAATFFVPVTALAPLREQGIYILRQKERAQKFCY